MRYEFHKPEEKEKKNGIGRTFLSYVSAVAAGAALIYFGPYMINKINEVSRGLEKKVVAEAPKVEKPKIIEEKSEVDYDSLIRGIIGSEDIRTKAYFDSKGHLTIGIGYNLEKTGARERIQALGLNYQDVCSGKKEITPNQAYILTTQDIQTAISDAKSYIGSAWKGLHPEAKEIVIDMAYNMGGGSLSEFKELRKALVKGDYVTASKEMKDSDWYGETGNRAKRLVKKMRSISSKK